MNELKKFISPFDKHVIKEYADFLYGCSYKIVFS